MWLDLGCGGSPRGQVNLDLFYGDKTPHTVQIIDPKEIKNFTIVSVIYIIVLLNRHQLFRNRSQNFGSDKIQLIV